MEAITIQQPKLQIATPDRGALATQPKSPMQPTYHVEGFA
jgi:hypothetical protein